MPCGCQATTVNNWTPNCPETSGSTAPNLGGNGGKGLNGFCWTCFSFWWWIAIAVIAFLLITHGGKKGKAK